MRVSRAFFLVTVVGLFVLWGATPAGSVVSQIDGTIVPVRPADLEGAINPYETTPIDAIRDAFTFPQIFLPPPYGSGLTVTFRDIQEQAGFENSFGWYNVGDPSRLYRIFSCYPTNNEPPDVVVVDFSAEFDAGHWDGGFIGFYIITPEGRPGGYRNCGDWEYVGSQNSWFGHIYFTESEQNGDGDYVHNLVYSSHDDPNRFYFAFEDLFRGGDNDFTDFTIQVTGLTPPCTPEAEVCDGQDNDCDGEVDEDDTQNPPVPLTQPCYTGPAGTENVGICHGGLQTCSGGSYGACVGEVTPAAEVCDNLDNDCNGTVDDNLTDVGGVCGSSVGECSPGITICTSGVLECSGETGPSLEVCDGRDNDCDGATDEDLGSTSCGLGVCFHTVPNCSAGVPQTCDPLEGASLEVCDGADNDCDGVADGLQRACYPSGTPGCSEVPPGSGTWVCEGTCSPGIQDCPAGGAGTWDSCLFAVTPVPEVCDNADNDCNGLVDDGLRQACYPPGSGPTTGCTEVSPGVWDCLGTCRAGQRTCQAGAWTGCAGHVTPAVEVCDGTDNDCDGQIDEPEDIPGLNQPCSTALGRCTPGTLRCVDGQEVCEGGAGPFPGECNGQDDDCDGEIDEPDEVAALEGQPCGDATGLCEPGRTQCVGGTLQCVGGVQPAEEVCDGADNDCNGAVDDGAECPPDFFCVQAECRPRCDPTREFPCPGTLQCLPADVGSGQQEFLCLPAQGDCGGTTCPEGWVCQNDVCVDPCDPNPCEAWQQCHAGACVDVSCTAPGRSCPPGEFCQDHACLPDPCAGADCDPEDTYCVRHCDEQGCTATCEPLCPCNGDERCSAAGTCEPDPCAGVSCEAGDRCGAAGTCEPDPCAGVSCDFGQVCFEGACYDDPCNQVACPAYYRCELRPDAQGAPVGICAPDEAYWVPGRPGDAYLGTGGGGCQCTAPGPGPAPASGLLLWGLLAAWGWRRRRRARARQRQQPGIRATPWLTSIGLLLLLPLFGCRLDPYETGEPGHWERDGGGVLQDAGIDATPDACVAATEICDGQDNDCDGLVDEDFDLDSDPRNCGACGVLCDLPFAFAACEDATCVMDHSQGEDGCLPGHWDVNGDPSDGCEYACHVTNDGTEICDGQDNDCDGLVDETFDLQNDPNNCGQCHRVCAFFKGVGACVGGQCTLQACQGGFVDKDGNPDNGCECQMVLEPTAVACQPSQPGSCGPGQVCADVTGDGSSVCANSPPDLCDGVDSDCDGQIDEDAQLASGGCYTHPVGCTETAPGVFDCVGACAPGVSTCVGGVDTCTGQVGPAAEVCNGADDDCDGTVDEGYDLSSDLANCGSCGYSCVAHAGAFSYATGCSGGTCGYACLPGHYDLDGDVAAGDGGTGCEYACVPSNGGVEKCGDGIDNDCNGGVDDGFDFQTDVNNCGTCGYRCADFNPSHAAPSACVAGACQYACISGWVDLDGDLGLGQAGNGCEYACTVTGVEVCDGQDNDCNGAVDDSPTDVGGTCGVTDVGPCQLGVWVCNSPNLECQGNIDPEPELCDSIDNDCDGTVDLPACLAADPADVRVDTSSQNSIQLDMDASGDRIYMAWLDTAGGDADILFACSSDGGATWAGPTSIYTGGRDAVKPRVLADPSGSGRVYVAWESFNGGNREIYVRTAADCGAAFSAQQRLDLDASDSLNIDLAADGNGGVAVVWEDFDEGTTIDDSVRNVWLASSADSGATWSTAVRVNDLTAESISYATVPQVAYGAAGRVLVVWVDRVAGGGDIYVRGSDDGGATWSVPSTRLDVGDSTHETSKFPRMAARSTGVFYVVWQDLRNTTSDIYLNVSADNGATWLGADVQLDDEGAPHDSYDANVVLGRAPGFVHVIWRDFRAGLPTVRVATSSDSGLTWAPSVVASAGGGFVSEPQLAANGAGQVVVAWVDDRNGLRDVFLNFSLDDGATFQPSDLRLDTGSSPGSADSFGVRLASGLGGVAYAAWIDTRRDGVNGDIYFNAAR